jgi:hypothetical protein
MNHDEIAKKVGEFLGEEGLRWFGHIKGLKGTCAATLKLNYERKRIPAHPIHLREGMQIRNFLRTLPECKEWDQNQLDDNWSVVVERAVELNKVS